MTFAKVAGNSANNFKVTLKVVTYMFRTLHRVCLGDTCMK